MSANANNPKKPTRRHKKPRREVFLRQLRKGLSVTAAAEASGYDRAGVYKARERDEEFAKAMDDAIEAGTDRLEDIGYRRATKHSDRLLTFLLEARRPDKYKKRIQSEHTGGITVNLDGTDAKA